MSVKSFLRLTPATPRSSCCGLTDVVDVEVGEVREGVTEEAGVTSSEPAPAESVVGKKSDKGAGDPSASPRGAIMSSVFAIAPKTLKVPSDFTSLLSFLTLIFGPGTRGVGLIRKKLSIHLPWYHLATCGKS